MTENTTGVRIEPEFDVDKLTTLKNNFNGYKYCPRCAVALKREILDDVERMVCQSGTCEFVYYHNPIPGAGVIVYDSRGALLVRRAHPPRIGSWCLPAGYMEWHESPEQTAVRETREETGLEVEIVGLFNVYSGDDDPRANAILTLYSARIVGGDLVAGDDASEVDFFKLDNLPKDIAFTAHRQALSDLRDQLVNGEFKG